MLNNYRTRRTVIAVNDLKILYGSLSHPTVKVQHVRLGFFVPDGCFVVQLDEVVHFFSLELLDY